MDGLVIGIDLCDRYTQVSCLDQEKTWTIPTVICNKKNSDEWYVGEKAYEYTLVGEGIIVDKLLKLVEKDGTATIGGVKYSGLKLLQMFLDKLTGIVKAETGNGNISQLVISLEKIDARLLDMLMYCGDYLNIPRNRMHIISHTESFVYYVMSQKREMWSNQVGMFNLADETLRYYEMKVQRGLRHMTVVAEFEDMDEGFNLNILENTSGAKLADRILCSCAERMLQKKLFSAMFLTGKGFEATEWAPEFMKLICNRRRVYIETSIFSKGAVYKAADYLQDKTSYPFVCICDGRLKNTISMKVQTKDKESQLILAAAGDNWYESKSTADLILDNQTDVEFMVSSMDSKRKKTVKIPLEKFPKRPNKTTRIQVSIGFLNEKTMVAVIKDRGFGELFPSSGVVIKQEVML